MKIHVIRPHLEDEKSKTGLGGYSDRIMSYINEEGYDTDLTEMEISIQNGIWTFVTKDVLGALLSTLRMRKGDIAHYTFEGSALYIPLCRSKKIVTFHHYVYKDENNSHKWYIIWKLSAMMGVKLADRIVAASDQTKEEIIEELDVDPDKIIVIPPMYNDKIRMDSSVPKSRCIGTMGTLTERKNYPALLRVFSKLMKKEGMQDLELHIVGTGPMEDAIIDLAEELGIRNCMHIHKNLDNRELNEFYNGCLLILNTSFHEGAGLLTLESQRCGTPVLYFDFAKIPECTVKEAVPCSSEEDMVIKCCRLLNDSDEYEKIRNRGLEYSEEYRIRCRNDILSVYNGMM